MVAEGWTNQYVDPRKAAKSYRPRAGVSRALPLFFSLRLWQTMSPGLLRARAPYRVRNVATGLLLGAFAVGIYSYSIHAVKQEEFDDIDDEARTLRNRTPSKISQEDEKRAMEAATSSVVSNVKGK